MDVWSLHGMESFVSAGKVGRKGRDTKEIIAEVFDLNWSASASVRSR
jgi:hypothetical protein